MRNMEGWIKIWRKTDDWEWRDKPEMVSLWLELLIHANVEDKKWHGITVKRGQLVASIDSLRKKIGLSVRTLRTCLSRLEHTGEITQKTTNKFRIITICKYDTYQEQSTSSQQATDKQSTNNRQATDKQSTTTKEYKNIENDKNIVVVDSARTRESDLKLEELKNSVMQEIKMQGAMKSLQISKETYMELASQILQEWKFSEASPEEINLRHFYNVLRHKAADHNSKQRYEENRRDFSDRRRGADTKSVSTADYEGPF